MSKEKIEKRIKELEELMKTLDCGDPKNQEVNDEWKRLKSILSKM